MADKPRKWLLHGPTFKAAGIWAWSIDVNEEARAVVFRDGNERIVAVVPLEQIHALIEEAATKEPSATE